MARLAVAAGLGALLKGNWIGMGAGETPIAGGHGVWGLNDLGFDVDCAEPDQIPSGAIEGDSHTVFRRE